MTAGTSEIKSAIEVTLRRSSWRLGKYSIKSSTVAIPNFFKSPTRFGPTCFKYCNEFTAPFFLDGVVFVEFFSGAEFSLFGDATFSSKERP